MAEKATMMVVKVDLQCPRCYKKIKKVLCKFPQIRDQIYDEKNNLVIITVVCCSPEKIKQKIICKGGDTIKGIEIKEPPKPKPPPEKPKEPEKKPEKPKEPEKKPEKPKEPEKEPKPKEPETPKEPPKPKELEKKPEKPKEPEKKPEKPKESEKPKEPEKPDPPKPPPPEPVVAYPPAPPAHPIGVCCRECYEGHHGGPCFSGYGRPPPPCYEGYGRPVYDSWGGGGNRGYYRCDYFCEENPSACTIM